MKTSIINVGNSAETHSGTTWEYGDAVLTVYQAKELFHDVWRSDELRDRVEEARQKYRTFYGDEIPLLDGYDRISAVYVVHVVYQGRLSKWYSLRFIPNRLESGYSDDLTLYRYKKGEMKEGREGLTQKLVDFLRQEKGIDVDEKDLVVTQSRFCSTQWVGEMKGDDKKKTKGLPSVAYMVMSYEFGKYAKAEGVEAAFFTNQAPEKVVKTVFKLGGKLLPIQTFGGFFEFGKEERIELAKDEEERIFLYPGYFLNTERLATEVRDLVATGKLQRSFVEENLHKVTYDRFVAEPHFKHLRNFGGFFNSRGPWANQGLTRADLKKHIALYVPDNPRLHFFRSTDWHKGIEEVMDFNQVVRGK